MIKHVIKIIYEDYEDRDEYFEFFKEKFMKFLKDNPLILKENDRYIENTLRDNFYLRDMLASYIEGDKEVLGDYIIDVIYDKIFDYQCDSIDKLFKSNAYKEMLKKARQLLCPAPTNSNE